MESDEQEAGVPDAPQTDPLENAKFLRRSGLITILVGVAIAVGPILLAIIAEAVGGQSATAVAWLTLLSMPTGFVVGVVGLFIFVKGSSKVAKLAPGPKTSLTLNPMPLTILYAFLTAVFSVTISLDIFYLQMFLPIFIVPQFLPLILAATLTFLSIRIGTGQYSFEQFIRVGMAMSVFGVVSSLVLVVYVLMFISDILNPDAGTGELEDPMRPWIQVATYGTPALGAWLSLIALIIAWLLAKRKARA